MRSETGRAPDRGGQGRREDHRGSGIGTIVTATDDISEPTLPGMTPEPEVRPLAEAHLWQIAETLFHIVGRTGEPGIWQPWEERQWRDALILLDFGVVKRLRDVTAEEITTYAVGFEDDARDNANQALPDCECFENPTGWFGRCDDCEYVIGLHPQVEAAVYVEDMTTPGWLEDFAEWQQAGEPTHGCAGAHCRVPGCEWGQR